MIQCAYERDTSGRSPEPIGKCHPKREDCHPGGLNVLSPSCRARDGRPASAVRSVSPGGFFLPSHATGDSNVQRSISQPHLRAKSSTYVREQIKLSFVDDGRTARCAQTCETVTPQSQQQKKKKKVRWWCVPCAPF